MFITTDEMKTHLYAEQIEAIAGDDETILIAAIDTAIAEEKGYLGDYDIATIFSATGSNRHPLLLTFAKDITIWHFLKLSNAGTDTEYRRSCYTAAIEWLKGVHRGDITADLPRKAVTTSAPGKIISGGAHKRDNHI